MPSFWRITSSTITTASQPGGMAPPVGTATQQPLSSASSAPVPMRISPRSFRMAGMASEQPKVSAERMV